MSRVLTSNYGAAAITQFAWATTDNDLFDRELDLYNLSQAVELHDHSAGRGLAVSRLAAGVVDAASLGALVVLTVNLNNLAVTNAKLAAGAVTYDKITFPLIQPSNDMTGGFRIRDTSNTYAFGFYIAANGLAVLGSGAAPGTAIAASLILGQAGQVSVGTTQGVAKLNVMQTVNTDGAGFRSYNTNTAFYSDLYNEATGYGCLSTGFGGASVISMWFATGKVMFGASNNPTARLNLMQSGGTNVDGVFIGFGGGSSRWYIDTSGHVNLQSATSNVLLMHTVAALAPISDNTHALGQAALRWTNVYAMAITSSGAISGTTGTYSGALGGLSLSATNGLSVGSIVSHLSPSPTLTWLLGNSGARYLGGYIGAAVFDSNGMFPVTTLTGQLGSTSNIWSSLTVDTAAKTGGGSFSAISDDKVKDSKAFRPYDQGLATLLLLKPVYYKYSGEYGIPSDREHVGFRAQQLQKIVPDMVGSVKMQRTPRSKEEDLLTVDDSRLPYILLNAIKELNDRITDLENRKN